MTRADARFRTGETPRRRGFEATATHPRFPCAWWGKDPPIYKSLVSSQFDAAFDMLEECLRACPTAKWQGKVGTHVEGEFPTSVMTREELLAHAAHCRKLVHAPPRAR